MFSIRRKLRVWRGKRDYAAYTRAGQPIEQNTISQWSDCRLLCVVDYITYSSGIDLVHDPIPLRTLENLEAVYFKRHPIDPQWLSDWEDRSLKQFRQMIEDTNKEES